MSLATVPAASASQAGKHMAVGVHGDGDGGVPEPLGGEGGGGVAVPDVVQPDPRKAGRPGELLEPRREPLRVDGPAGRPGEHQAGLAPARPHGEALLGLAGTVLSEARHRRASRPLGTTSLPAILVASTPGETSDLLTVLGMLLG